MEKMLLHSLVDFLSCYHRTKIGWVRGWTVKTEKNKERELPMIRMIRDISKNAFQWDAYRPLQWPPLNATTTGCMLSLPVWFHVPLRGVSVQGVSVRGVSVWRRSLSRGMSVQRPPVNRQTGVKTLPSLAVGNYNNFTFKLNLLHSHLHLELHLVSLEATNKWINAWWRYRLVIYSSQLSDLICPVIPSVLRGISNMMWHLPHQTITDLQGSARFPMVLLNIYVCIWSSLYQKDSATLWSSNPIDWGKLFI